jgi:hypothetical protein
MVECLRLEKRSVVVPCKGRPPYGAGFPTIADRRSGYQAYSTINLGLKRNESSQRGIKISREVMKRDWFGFWGSTALLSGFNSVCVDHIYSLNDGGNK